MISPVTASIGILLSGAQKFSRVASYVSIPHPAPLLTYAPNSLVNFRLQSMPVKSTTMSSDADTKDLLCQLSYECESLFENIQRAQAPTQTETSILKACAEFQQRFSIWTAHLGVFARKSQCLDRRLQNFPDLLDLVARLLDLLRRCLQQCIVQLDGRDGQALASQEGHVPAHTANLGAINDTLTRINRLGVTIRQSSRLHIDARAKKFATGRDLKSFSYLCAIALELLYPGAQQSLRDRLSKSMTDRYARMLFLESRNTKLQTHRKRHPHRELPARSDIPDNRAQVDIPAIPKTDLAGPSSARAFTPLSQTDTSDLSSIDIQHFRGCLGPSGEPLLGPRKPSSIQVNQHGYPPLPISSDHGNGFSCEWCAEPFTKETMTESDWR